MVKHSPPLHGRIFHTRTLWPAASFGWTPAAGISRTMRLVGESQPRVDSARENGETRRAAENGVYDPNHLALWYLIAASPLLLWPEEMRLHSSHSIVWLARAPYGLQSLKWALPGARSVRSSPQLPSLTRCTRRVKWSYGTGDVLSCWACH